MAIQDETNYSIKGKQLKDIANRITANHDAIDDIGGELASKQDTLSSTQLDAVNSGINSTKVGQIATNTTNIGDLTTLTTTANTSTVAAINELDSDLSKVEPLSGSGAPTTSTVGAVGQFYVDTATGDIYYLSAIVPGTAPDPDTYTWNKAKGTQIKQTTDGSTFTDIATYSYAGTGSSAVPYGMYIGNISNEDMWTYVKTNSFTTEISQAYVGGYIYDDTEQWYGHKEARLALYDDLKNRIISGAGAPTASTVGTKGQLYEDTTNGELYICTDVSGSTYTWNKMAKGADTPTIVQTTGTSQTDVMSQDAVTSMVYPNYQYQSDRIVIGENATGAGRYSTSVGDYAKGTGDSSVALGSRATALGGYSISIGSGSGTSHQSVVYSGSTAGVAIGHQAHSGAGTVGENIKGAVAIGPHSKATVTGQFDIGSQESDYGYNNSNYRLLTGVYDGQTAHDAATKGQLDTAIINGGTTAPTTSTVGAVGTQYTYVDTAGTPTAHLYVCTEVNGSTYTWSQLI